jgi:nucleoside-diphosphate-sugar epimerase
MQVFVTGANGFIGGAVAAALIAAGHKVRGLVRNKAAGLTGRAAELQRSEFPTIPLGPCLLALARNR